MYLLHLHACSGHLNHQDDLRKKAAPSLHLPALGPVTCLHVPWSVGTGASWMSSIFGAMAALIGHLLNWRPKNAATWPVTPMMNLQAIQDL